MIVLCYTTEIKRL